MCNTLTAWVLGSFAEAVRCADGGGGYVMEVGGYVTVKGSVGSSNNYILKRSPPGRKKMEPLEVMD